MQPPSVNITMSEAAVRAVQDVSGEADGDDVLHLAIDARYQTDLFFAPRGPSDLVIEVSGITLAMDASTAKRADGVAINYVDGRDGIGFKLDNPNQTLTGVRPADVQRMVEAGERLHLIDVRTEAERARARLENFRLLDARLEAELETLPRDSKLVLLSHHSGRSRRAARLFESRGFTKVSYVFGGIDAWSTMDPSVPRY